MLSVIFCFVMLNFAMLSVSTLNNVMLSFIMLNVVMLSVVRLSKASFKTSLTAKRREKRHELKAAVKNVTNHKILVATKRRQKTLLTTKRHL